MEQKTFTPESQSNPIMGQEKELVLSELGATNKLFTVTPQTSVILNKLNLLTPPSSAEVITSLLNFEPDTPRSHLNLYFPPTSLLPSEFNSKCQVTANSPCVSSRRGSSDRCLTPRKKSIKPSVTFNVNLTEHKENSPIKVECDYSPASCWYSNKPLQPRAWSIRPPPSKFGLPLPTSGEPTYKDILTCIHQRGMVHILNKVSYLFSIYCRYLHN